jgi:hypothetical protein
MELTTLITSAMLVEEWTRVLYIGARYVELKAWVSCTTKVDLFKRRCITMVTYALSYRRLSGDRGFFGTEPIPWHCLTIFFMRDTDSHQRVFVI